MESRTSTVAIALIVAGAAPALLSLLALVSYFMDMGGHHFGSEVGGFIYTTPYHYVALNALIVVLFAVAISLRKWSMRFLIVAAQFVLFLATIVPW